jgi:hypothetical protein
MSHLEILPSQEHPAGFSHDHEIRFVVLLLNFVVLLECKCYVEKTRRGVLVFPIKWLEKVSFTKKIFK